MKIKRYFLPVLISTVSLMMIGCGDKLSPSQQPTTPTEGAAPAASHAETKPFQKLVLSLISSTATAASELGGACSIDGISGSGVANTGNSFTLKKVSLALLTGWLISVDNKSADHFELIFKGNGIYIASGVAGELRADLAKGYGDGAVHAGFQFLVDTSGVDVGKYDLFLQESGPSGEVLCDTHKHIIVTD